MRVESVNKNKLVVYENNPRNNDKAKEYVKESIEKFGYLNPIIVNKDYVILCGHTRLKALMDIKDVEMVDVIVVDDLSEEQENMFRLVDNKVSEYSSWDYDKVLQESADIIDDYLKDFGFEYHKVDDMDIKEEDYISDEVIEKKVIVCPYCGEEVK